MTRKTQIRHVNSTIAIDDVEDDHWNISTSAGVWTIQEANVLKILNTFN